MRTVWRRPGRSGAQPLRHERTASWCVRRWVPQDIESLAAILSTAAVPTDVEWDVVTRHGTTTAASITPTCAGLRPRKVTMRLLGSRASVVMDVTRRRAARVDYSVTARSQDLVTAVGLSALASEWASRNLGRGTRRSELGRILNNPWVMRTVFLLGGYTAGS